MEAEQKQNLPTCSENNDIGKLCEHGDSEESRRNISTITKILLSAKKSWCYTTVLGRHPLTRALGDK